jgi:hypothetical protein
MYSHRTVSKIKTRTIENLPFAELAMKYGNLVEDGKLSSDAKAEFAAILLDFSTTNNIKKNAEWVFSQMLAKFAELPLEKNENGLYSGKAMFRAIRTSPFMSGMLLVCKHPTRSIFLTGQTSPLYSAYCSLVPLVMSAFKRYKQIQYSEWDRAEISSITEPTLAEAMLLTELPDITREEVIEAREIALTPLSGPHVGVMKNPATTYILYLRKESGMVDLPTLAKIMLCQTWCAHPVNRNNYMILNPLNWDELPEELISTSILQKNPYKPSEASYSSAEW